MIKSLRRLLGALIYSIFRRGETSFFDKEKDISRYILPIFDLIADQSSGKDTSHRIQAFMFMMNGLVKGLMNKETFITLVSLAFGIPAESATALFDKYAVRFPDLGKIKVAIDKITEAKDPVEFAKMGLSQEVISGSISLFSALDFVWDLIQEIMLLNSDLKKDSQLRQALTATPDDMKALLSGDLAPDDENAASEQLFAIMDKLGFDLLVMHGDAMLLANAKYMHTSDETEFFGDLASALEFNGDALSRLKNSKLAAGIKKGVNTARNIVAKHPGLRTVVGTLAKTIPAVSVATAGLSMLSNLRNESPDLTKVSALRNKLQKLKPVANLIIGKDVKNPTGGKESTDTLLDRIINMGTQTLTDRLQLQKQSGSLQPEGEIIVHPDASATYKEIESKTGDTSVFTELIKRFAIKTADDDNGLAYPKAVITM